MEKQNITVQFLFCFHLQNLKPYHKRANKACESSVNNIPVLLTSLSYIIYNVSSKQDVEVTFKYKYEVGTPEWYLTQYVWVEISWFTLIDGYWYNFTDDSMKSVFTFNPDGTYIQFWNGKDYTGNWYFDKKTNPITLNGVAIYQKKVEYLDDKKLILSFQSGETGIIVDKITYTNDGVRRFK